MKALGMRQQRLQGGHQRSREHLFRRDDGVARSKYILGCLLTLQVVGDDDLGNPAQVGVDDGVEAHAHEDVAHLDLAEKRFGVGGDSLAGLDRSG